jgi:transposase
MTTMPDQEPTRVVVGVDTHRDVHVAVALDALGHRLDAMEVWTTQHGYADLLTWASELGEIDAFGIEGTNCYGAALARFLAGQGFTVIEVLRPARQVRRHHGKSDRIDAEAAARAVISGEANAVPKAGTATVEMIRALRIVRAGVIKARTQAVNAARALVVTAPPELRDELRDLSAVALMTRAARLRPGPAGTSPLAATRIGLRSLGQRWQHLDKELRTLDGHLDELVARAAPALVACFGVGTDTAGALLVAAGDNPQRLKHEAAFAMLCGASPRDASSGLQRRHRLNRAGDRQANAALYRVALVRMRWHQPTRTYVERRLKEGKTKREIIRCLKRYIARELYKALPNTT